LRQKNQKKLKKIFFPRGWKKREGWLKKRKLNGLWRHLNGKLCLKKRKLGIIKMGRIIL